MRRLIEPFGSLKKFIILLSVFLLSRFVDLLLTYWGLEADGWELEWEKSMMARALMEWLGFLPSAIVGTILATGLVLVGARLIFSFTTRMVGATRARRETMALMLWGSMLGPLYGLGWLTHISKDFDMFHEFFLFLNILIIPAVEVRLVISIVSAVLIVGAILLWPSSKRPT